MRRLPETFEDDEAGEFGEAWTQAKSQGWLTAKEGGEWVHRCPTDGGAVTALEDIHRRTTRVAGAIALALARRVVRRRLLLIWADELEDMARRLREVVL